MVILLEKPNRLVTYLDTNSKNRAFQWNFTGETSPYVDIINPPEDPDWNSWKKYGGLTYRNNFVDTTTIDTNNNNDAALFTLYNITSTSSGISVLGFTPTFALSTRALSPLGTGLVQAGYFYFTIGGSSGYDLKKIREGTLSFSNFDFLDNNTAGGVATNVTFYITLSKVSGATTTLLATGSPLTIALGSASVMTQYKNQSVYLTVPNNAIFNLGDLLRIDFYYQYDTVSVRSVQQLRWGSQASLGGTGYTNVTFSGFYYSDVYSQFLEKCNLFGSNTNGNTVETEIQFNTPYNYLQLNLSMYDESYYETLSITGSAISLVNAGGSYSVDMINSSHTLRMTLVEGLCKVYLDGVLVLSGTTTQTTLENKLRLEFISTFTALPTPAVDFKSLKYSRGINYSAVTLANIDYELQVDSSPHFDSINLNTYTINHNDYSDDTTVVYGVGSLPRQFDEAPVFYWRVRVNNASYISEYINGLAYNVPIKYTEELFSDILTALPDDNAYSKGAKSSNTAIVLKSYANSLDLAKYTNDEVKDTFKWYNLKDTDLSSVLGGLLQFSASSGQSNASYRNQLQNLLEAYRRTTVKAALYKVVLSFTGVYPILKEYIKSDFFLLVSQTGKGDDRSYSDFKNRRFFLKDDVNSNILPEVTLWSKDSVSHIVDITILNPYSVTYNSSTLNVLIRKVNPAHLNNYIS